MSSQSSYARNGSHSRSVRQNSQHPAHDDPCSDKPISQFYHHSQGPIRPQDSGHYLGSSREMGPPPFPSEFPTPPQPIEVGQMEVNNARTLPTPSASSSTPWNDFPTPGFGGFSDYGPGRPLPVDNQVRTTAPDPLQQWYTGNDGPWIPKNISAVPDERLHSSRPRAGNRMPMPYGSHYRQPNPSDAGSFQYGIAPSDSGYGTRHSDESASVFSSDINDRDQDCQSLVGHVADYQPFQGLNNEVLQQRDTRATDTWAPVPSTSPTNAPSLVCPTCQKPVKTRSELKKHDLRHRKPFVCKYPGCTRTDGFSTTNDLERHTKSKHPEAIAQLEPTKRYRCHVQGCKSKEKSWPRLDNFRSHLKRVHAQALQTDDDFENMIRRAEFLERTGVATGPDVVSSQRPFHPNPSRAFGPVALSIPPMDRNVEPNWKPIQAYPKVGQPALDSIDPKQSMLENHSEVSTPDSNAPTLAERPQQTVQPQDVFQPPTEIRNNPSSLDSLLAPVGATESAIKNADRVTPQPAANHSKAIAQGKATRQKDEPASDATLTEAIITALAGAEIPESSSLQKDLGQDNLPHGQPSSGGSQPVDPHSAMPSTGKPLGHINVSNSAAVQEDSRSLQQKKAREVLRTLQELGYILQKDPSHSPKPQNPGSAASNKSDNLVTCQMCKRFTGRPCELKKHMKRHSRPYGCTFLTCSKTFGSKNDWKRHENSQHFHLETWRCDEERVEGGACAKVCYRRQSFQEHLKKDHHISDTELVKAKVEGCRIGRNCQARFWCGFCSKLVDLTKKGVEAWTERFDHIDDHFMGRRGLTKQGIQDWIPVDGDKPRGETLDLSPGKDSQDNHSDGSSSGSQNGSSPEASGAAGGSPALAINVDEACEKSAKRGRSSSGDDNRPNKHRKTVRRDTIVYCCQCHQPNNPKFNPSCVLCDNRHQFCSNCEVEVTPAGQDPAPEEA